MECGQSILRITIACEFLSPSFKAQGSDAAESTQKTLHLRKRLQSDIALFRTLLCIPIQKSTGRMAADQLLIKYFAILRFRILALDHLLILTQPFRLSN